MQAGGEKRSFVWSIEAVSLSGSFLCFCSFEREHNSFSIETSLNHTFKFNSVFLGLELNRLPSWRWQHSSNRFHNSCLGTVEDCHTAGFGSRYPAFWFGGKTNRWRNCLLCYLDANTLVLTTPNMGGPMKYFSFCVQPYSAFQGVSERSKRVGAGVPIVLGREKFLYSSLLYCLS